MCESAFLDGVNKSNPSLMMLFSGSWFEELWFSVRSGRSHPSKQANVSLDESARLLQLTPVGEKSTEFFFLAIIYHHLVLSQSAIS